MDLIDRIGAVLGLAAFLGLAVLVLLFFQQSREIRRLREWAGKAPERAAAAAEEQGLEPPEPELHWVSRVFAGIGAFLAKIGSPFARAWQTIDRNSPIDPRVLAPVLAIAAAAAALFLVHPFGLLEGDTTGGHGGRTDSSPDRIEVAVLNATASDTAPAVPGLARQVGQQVKDAGYKLGPVGDASGPSETTIVMFAPDHKSDARDLVDALPNLGDLKLQAMTTDVGNLAGAATLALILGQDQTGV